MILRHFISIKNSDLLSGCDECMHNVVAHTTVLDAYTYWNGKCKVFQFDHYISNFGSKAYIPFDVNKNESYFFMITSRNEYIFASAQQWLKNPSMTVDIKSNMFVEFQRLVRDFSV